jgi:hypothetical protein
MKRFCGFPPTPEFTGDLEEMSLLAGESVGQTNRLMSAASIIDEIMNGAEAVIRKRLGSMCRAAGQWTRPRPYKGLRRTTTPVKTPALASGRDSFGDNRVVKVSGV